MPRKVQNTPVLVSLEGETCDCNSCRDVFDDERVNSRRVLPVITDDAMTDEHVARLLSQLEFLTAHPDRHNQETWFKLGAQHRMIGNWSQATDYAPVRAELGSIENCGSVACLAGWTVLRTESIPLVRDRMGDVWPGRQLSDGTWVSEDTSVAAAKYLGLHVNNARALFCADNTLADLWRMSAVITNARITIPEPFRSGGPRQVNPQAAELLAYAELG